MSNLLNRDKKELAENKPHVLRQISLNEVKITDEFWAPKLETMRTVTLPDVFGKFEKEGAFNNFDKVRDGEKGDHVGPPWYDGLICETIRAASDFMITHYDPELDARLDGYIERIAAAAAVDPDGYIATWTILKEPDHRWGENNGNLLLQHDVYNAGALVEAAVHHYRATSKINLLKVAVRYANYMCDYMGYPPKHNVVPAHSLPEEAFIKLYHLFREFPQLRSKFSPPVDEIKYLCLAQFWINNRGHHDGRNNFGAYAQDHKPVIEQDEIVGHAVRASLMCTGLISLAMATGKAEYYNTAIKLWESAVYRKMHITGGVGAVHNEEKFGQDYYLPEDAYLETCAAVGMGFFHHNMNIAFADGKYADELERVLYNGVLNGVSLEGNTYFYQNPLASKGHVRWEWHGCPCCPPMLLKIMASLPSYIYAYSGDNIYVNLYIGSMGAFVVKDTTIKLIQETCYPWDGRIKITIDSEKEIAFAINVRIPGWAVGKENPGDLYHSSMSNQNVSMAVNGKAIDTLDIYRGYACIHRNWRSGDTIELNLPMDVRRIYAHPKVKDYIGRVALQHGPIVYCLESVDNSGILESYFLKTDTRLFAEYRPDLLNGVAVVTGSAICGSESDQPVEVKLTAIPFYAQNNRELGTEMRVWLKENLSEV